MAFMLEKGFRYLNQRSVFRKIRENGVITRRQIAQQMDLSFQTVANIVSELLETELVVSDGLINQNAGKRPESLKVNPSGLYAAGVLLDRTGFEATLIDLLGGCQARSTHPLSSLQPDITLRQIADVIEDFLVTMNIPSERFAGVGISSPGPIDFRVGAVSKPPNFPGWTFVPIQQRLSDMIGYPVTLVKDSHAAALAEIWALNNASASSLFYLYFSAGIGGALVVNRRIWTGFSGNAGEIGHVVVSEEGACECGRIGCLEAVWSLGRAANEAHLSLEDLVRLLQEESSPQWEQWQKGIPLLARVVVDVANMIEPETIIIGGPQGEQIGDNLIGPLNDALQREGFVHNLRPITARMAIAKNAASVGAGLVQINTTLTMASNSSGVLGLDI